MARRIPFIAMILCLAFWPLSATAEESDDRQFWYGFGVGAAGILCGLLESNQISKDTVIEQIESLQEPAPDIDVKTITEAINDLKSNDEFSKCIQ